MALSKIQSESINLADTFAFTGTVSGTNDTQGLVAISRSQSGSAVSQVLFDNLSTDYDTFVFYITYMHPVTDNVQPRVRFLNSSGSQISGTGNYGAESQTHTNGQNGANSMDHMIIAPANMGNNSYEGFQGVLTLSNRNYASGQTYKVPPAIFGHLSTSDGANNQNGVNFAGALDNSAQQAIRGIKFYFSSGNIDAHDISCYGVVRPS